MESFKEALEVLKGRDSRKLGNNTYLQKRGENIAVKLHQTDVVTYTPNGEVILSSGGWKTVTTKDRINQFSPVRIYQKNHVWHVGDHIFKDGMTIDASGTVKGADVYTPAKERVFQAQKRRLLKYAKNFSNALIKGKVKSPSAGDCFFCSMKDEQGKTIGDVSHFEQHMKENYFVPSLLYNALTETGASMYTKGSIGNVWRGEDKGENIPSYVKEDVKKHVYKYLLRKFAIA